MKNKMKVLGPYKRPDGRFIVNIIYPDRRTSMSYPKYLMEQHLGRKLKRNETIHHKDEIVSHNYISNLKIKKRVEHSKYHRPKLKEDFTCPTCQNIFTLTGVKLSDHKKAKKQRVKKGINMTGPYCNRQCAGHAGKGVCSRIMA